MSRQEALSSLLATEVGVAPQEYPPTLTLPDYIHTRALEAVTDTLGDDRERSIFFRYRRERWIGGMSVRGPVVNIDHETASAAGHANILHTLWADLYPPHVHFHSHPTLTPEPEPFEAQLVPALEEAGLTPDANMLALAKDASTKLMGAVLAMPSRGDIYKLLIQSPASVASMVAGEKGRFLCVHRDLKVTKSGLLEHPLKPHTKQYKRQRQEALYTVDPVYRLSLIHISEPT